MEFVLENFLDLEDFILESKNQKEFLKWIKTFKNPKITMKSLLQWWMATDDVNLDNVEEFIKTGHSHMIDYVAVKFKAHPDYPNRKSEAWSKVKDEVFADFVKDYWTKSIPFKVDQKAMTISFDYKHKDVEYLIEVEFTEMDDKFWDRTKSDSVDEMLVNKLKEGQKYLYTGGAEHMEVTYIGRAEEHKDIKVGSSMGKGFVFEWPEGKKYFELGHKSVKEFIHDEVSESVFSKPSLDNLTKEVKDYLKKHADATFVSMDKDDDRILLNFKSDYGTFYPKNLQKTERLVKNSRIYKEQFKKAFKDFYDKGIRGLINTFRKETPQIEIEVSSYHTVKEFKDDEIIFVKYWDDGKREEVDKSEKNEKDLNFVYTSVAILYKDLKKDISNKLKESKSKIFSDKEVLDMIKKIRDIVPDAADAVYSYLVGNKGKSKYDEINDVLAEYDLSIEDLNEELDVNEAKELKWKKSSNPKAEGYVFKSFPHPKEDGYRLMEPVKLKKLWSDRLSKWLGVEVDLEEVKNLFSASHGMFGFNFNDKDGNKYYIYQAGESPKSAEFHVQKIK